jgi:insertion element IS1 protein InsB
MDKQTRQIIPFHVGDRSQDSAAQVWVNIPEVYREQATFYTAQYAAYTGVIAAAQHQAIHQECPLTFSRTSVRRKS